jgi:hypothetical protein
MITLLCDFCCQEPMAAFYPCRSFATAGEEDAAMGSCFPVSDYCFDSGAEGFEGWTACETCHQLVECAAIEALAQRAYSLEKERHFESNPIDYYRAMFLLFFDHRTGPAYANELEDAS